MCLSGCVAQPFEDRGLEVGKRVCVLCDAEIHCDARPNLPIFEKMQGLLE